MTAPDTAQATVERVLAEHDWRWAIRESRTGEGVRIACTAPGCDWYADRDEVEDVWRAHRAHVAAVIVQAQAADITDRDTLAAELERVSAERDEFFARLTKHERQWAERLAEHASIGDTGICRNCTQLITYEVVSETGYNDRTGWSDGSRRDALVCFKAVHYAHVPLVGRERGIWDAATRTALGDAHDDRGRQ